MLIKKIILGASIALLISACSMKNMYHSDKALVLFILDTSGSMNDLEGDESKLVKAKRSIVNTINQIDKSRFNVGIITFDSSKTLVDALLGKERDCKSQLLVSPNNNIDEIIKKIKPIKAEGKTPLANAIALSKNVVKNINKRMIILLSDGEETCGGTPVVEAKKLYNQYGNKINFQVIGYAVNDTTKKELKKISRIGKNWKYYNARDIRSLNIAINTILTKNNIRDSSIWLNSTKFAFEFSSGSIKLKEEYIIKIGKIYNYLKHNHKSIIIVGHTDSIGSLQENIDLALKRAKMVKFKLIELGIDVNRIQVLGKGESHPITSNATEGGRRKNRRVEIDILD